MTRFIRTREDGSVLVMVLIMALAFSVIGMAFTTYSIAQRRLTYDNVYRANALLVAEAGIERSVSALNASDDFEGYAISDPEAELFDNIGQGRGVFETTVVNSADSNTKVITSTGKVYRQSDLDSPVATSTVRVTVVGTQSDGASVSSGAGGLIMSGGGKLFNSDVYVNGTITMSGGAQIGQENAPVRVDVAHQSCPTGSNPGPTYPVVCTSGQPLSMSNGTRIYGEVCATNQTTMPAASAVIPASGLLLPCTAPPVPMITYDRAAHIAAVTTTASSNDNTYTCSGWPFTRTWPANFRLNGNYTTSSNNGNGNCDVTLNGNAYITGNLQLANNMKFRVPESAGTTRPVIIVDGTVTIGGGASIIPNSFGTSAHIISFKSAGSCNPNCTTLTGNELRTSLDQTNVSIGGGAVLPGAVFQAYWSKVVLDQGGQVGALAGQTIQLDGGGSILLGTQLATGTKTWGITSYQRIFQ